MTAHSKKHDGIVAFLVVLAGFCIGVSVFFLLVPFVYSSSAVDFPQWLQGVAGPLGFASVALIAYTTLLQQQQFDLQQRQNGHAECEGLLEAYRHLMDTTEVISAEQHAGPPEFRRGSIAFSLIMREYRRRVEVIPESAARDSELGSFLRKYRDGVEPFQAVMLELMNKAKELESLGDAEACETVKRKVVATVPLGERSALGLFCQGADAGPFREWLGLSS
jgi:hypothetical protein